MGTSDAQASGGLFLFFLLISFHPEKMLERYSKGGWLVFVEKLSLYLKVERTKHLSTRLGLGWS